MILQGLSCNIDSLSSPHFIHRNSNYEIYQWGWTGIDYAQVFHANILDTAKYIINNAIGSFFIIIRNIQSNNYVFFVDLFACKKIYYCSRDARIFFYDFLYKIANCNINTSSVLLYLMYGYIIDDNTIFDGVKVLKPYTIYEVNQKKVTEYRIFDIRYETKFIDYDTAVRTCASMFDDYFGLLTHHFRKALIPLSGGRDSRFLLGLALKHFNKKDISTFTFGQRGTFDFEIGRSLAKSVHVSSFLQSYNPKTYFYEYVVPSTKYYSGMVNHSFDAPAKKFEKVLGEEQNTTIISGHPGDLLFSWKYYKKTIQYKNLILPEPSCFSLQSAIGLSKSQEEEVITRICGVMKDLPVVSHDSTHVIECGYWDYYVRDPYFNQYVQYCEENYYPFSFPFLNRKIIEFVNTIPKAYKQSPDFYKDILKVDADIFQLFHFPLKNYRGFGYDNSVLQNLFGRYALYFKAFCHGSRPMKNYVNFGQIYTTKFFNQQFSSVSNCDFLNRLLNDQQLHSMKQKTLMLSLKLNMETFFH